MRALEPHSAPMEDRLQNLSISHPGQKSRSPRQAHGRITLDRLVNLSFLIKLVAPVPVEEH